MPNETVKTGSRAGEKPARGPSRRKFLGLALAAAAVAVAAWRLSLRRPAFNGAQLSVAEAHAQAGRGDIWLIDIRRPDEWRRTGIGEGAHPIDMRRKDFTQVLHRVVQTAPDRPVALICARGVRSARFGKALISAGYDNIVDVPEGMLGSSAGPGWLRSGLPVRRYDGDAG